MPTPVYLNKLFTVLASCTILAACASSGEVPKIENYPVHYEQVSKDFQKNHSDSFESNLVSLEKFRLLFADFKQPDLEQLIVEAYAEELYFNDTLKTFTNRKELSDYLLETADRVDYTRVYFDDVVQSGNNYYIRWTMETGFNALSRTIETESIGMSQVRLNEQGKVVFHQDFWDSTEGFFRHLPVIGYFINRTKNRL